MAEHRFFRPVVPPYTVQSHSSLPSLSFYFLLAPVCILSISTLLPVLPSFIFLTAGSAAHAVPYSLPRGEEVSNCAVQPGTHYPHVATKLDGIRKHFSLFSIISSAQESCVINALELAEVEFLTLQRGLACGRQLTCTCGRSKQFNEYPGGLPSTSA